MIAPSARLCKLVAAALFGASLGGCVVAGIDLDALRQIPGQPAPGQGMAAGNSMGAAMPMPDPAGPALTTPAAGSAAPSEIIGRGPVRVALLLPLSGDANLSQAGRSMANGARLAMSFIEASPNIADNITVVLRDTGTAPDGGARQAQAALADGVSLVLGPMLGSQLPAASQVTRNAGIPMISFASNGALAGPGVYLLSVLPEMETRRVLAYARAQGKSRIAGLFPAGNLGAAQKQAFEQGMGEQGFAMSASLGFADDAQLRAAIQTLAQARFDALYLPDRASAPKILAALKSAGVKPGLVLGSSQWQGANDLFADSAFAGAVFPSVDDKGLRALAPEYRAKFGGEPHPLATISYTAVILVNNSRLSLTNPRYDRNVLTNPSGFAGSDGVFRFLADGRSQYALVIKRIGAGSASIVDAAKL